MSKTNGVFETGLVIHLIGAYAWMPLFYLAKFPMWASWLIGYLPFQVVAGCIMFPIVYRQWRKS